MRILVSIFRQFFDYGFAVWRVKKRVSIVPCPINSIEISTTYKLTGVAIDWLAEHCICFVLEHMRIPHSILGHFFGSRVRGRAGCKIKYLLFRILQIAPTLPRYTN
jgi:hypothetical protein